MALNYLLCYSIHHILVCMICSVDTSIISNVLTQCEPTINLYRKVIQLQENLDKWVAYHVTEVNQHTTPVTEETITVTTQCICTNPVSLLIVSTILVYKTLCTFFEVSNGLVSPPLDTIAILVILLT